jgi:hypothetical protein
MNPVLICIAKKEELYIEEFVKYHLALGFKKIYLYDNEDVPTYEKFLEKYKEYLVVIHLPFNNYNKPVQYMALDHFAEKILFKNMISHVAHIDIDEFICLKKHFNISEFINEYIVGDCEGIGMNWRFFGSSGKTEQTSEPVTQRFTMCEKNGNKHIKTLFKRDYFVSFGTCHDIRLSKGNVKSTDGRIIVGPFNDPDLSVIQVNHYKSKTLPEFRYIRTRQRADMKNGGTLNEDVDANFKHCDINEVEDLTARNFYSKVISHTL